MKHASKRFFYLLAASLMLGTSGAFAADGGFYLGGSVGQTESDASAGDIGAGFSGSIDDTDTGWRLLAGFRFTPNFAIEGAYVDLGENSVSGTLNGVTLSGSGEFDGWQLAGLVRFPLTGNVGLFGKAGAFLWDLDGSGGLGGASSGVSDDGTDLTYGAGVDIGFAEMVSARIEWERFETDPVGTDLNIDFWSVSLLIHFQ